MYFCAKYCEWKLTLAAWMGILGQYCHLLSPTAYNEEVKWKEHNTAQWGILNPLKGKLTSESPPLYANII